MNSNGSGVPSPALSPRAGGREKNCAKGFVGVIPWEVRVDGAASGERNMDMDRELLAAQKNPAARPVVRFFRWSEPTVSYGRTQDPALAEAFALAAGVRAVVRRPTGGGVVHHDTDLSFSLTWRRDAPGFPPCIKNVYRAIHERLAAVLLRRGVEVALHAPAPQRAPGLCFAEPVESDVMWQGEKIIGGALSVTSWGRLYQGDIRGAALTACGLSDADVAAEFLGAPAAV